MDARERELFELLHRRGADEDPGVESGASAPEEPGGPAYSGGVVRPGAVVLSRWAVLAAVVVAVVLCIVSGLVGYALAG